MPKKGILEGHLGKLTAPMPHDNREAARIHRYLILRVSMIAVDRLSVGRQSDGVKRSTIG